MKLIDNRLSAKKKAATIIIDIGLDNAAKVYRFLREDEIEQLTLEISGMQKLKPETVEETLAEFYESCLAQKYITEGGLEYAKNILDKVMDAETSDKLIQKVSLSLNSRAFGFLRKADPKHLLSFIQNEHPQTIALILSYANSDQASMILADLPREIQVDVAERIANMDRTSPEIVKEVEKSLESKFATVMNVDFAEIGGIKYMAELLNTVDRSTEKHIMEEMKKKDPKLTEEIRKRMFVFEDITDLDNITVQRVLREVDMKDLVIALKGAGEEVSNIVHSNVSKHTSEAIIQEQEFLRGVRLRDVEEAQQRIVGVIRRLEESGEIVVAHGRKDEFIV